MIKTFFAIYFTLAFSLSISTAGLFLIGNKAAAMNSLICLTVLVVAVELFKHGLMQGMKDRERDSQKKESSD